VTLAGLGLFRERAGALEAKGPSSASDSGSWSGISTSIIESGEGSLGLAVVGLACRSMLLVKIEVAVLVGLGLVALTWNLEGRQV
jgi:hypothetical protein